MGDWGGFVEGLANGIPQGVNTYSTLRMMAQRERQMQLQQQNQQRLEQQGQQAQKVGQFNALTNLAKIKDPKQREAAFAFQAPILGIDPADPQAKAYMDAMSSDDPQVAANFKAFAQQLGVSPEGASVLGGLDQPQGVENLLRLKGIMQGADTANERMGLAQQRLDLANQQYQLSGQRFDQQQLMQGLRANGLIPPMGYTPQQGPGGQISLAPIPGGPATVPTESENKAADYLTRAQASNAAGMAFLQKNPDYLGSNRSMLDQALQTEMLPGVGPIAGIGAGLGAAAGAVVGRGHYGAVMAGSALGGGVGAAAQEPLAAMLTSDKGREFQAAWGPFINATERRESGAAIKDSEWRNAMKRYIPLPQDTPDVIAQKEANRNTAMQGIGISANRALGKVGMSTPVRTLDPQVEQTAEALARKVQAGQATPQERAQLGAILKAKGYDFQ